MTTRTLSPCGAPALILLPGAGATNTATRPTASRMVRDTGAILRDGPTLTAVLPPPTKRNARSISPLDRFTAPSGSPLPSTA